MPIESIGAVLGSGRPALERTGLGQEAFLEILLTQLTFQDPLKPLDNEDFVAQLAQFTSLEQARQTTENTDLLLRVESVAQSLRLLGKVVQVQTNTGNEVGRVSTVTFDEQGTPRLGIVLDTGAFLSDIGLAQIGIISDGVANDTDGEG